MSEMNRDLMRAKTARWCYKTFIQDERYFECYREKNHTGDCDSQLAQERRMEYCRQLVGAEGVY